MTTETDDPDWLQNYKASSKAPVKQEPTQPPSSEPVKKGFQPGVSGNPNGRPKGARNKKTLAVQEFEKEGSAIAQRVVDEALKGCMIAAEIALRRIAPPLKATRRLVKFKLDPKAPLTAQAQDVIVAVAEGDVDVDSGKVLLDCISALAGIKSTDELEARLNELETRMGKRN